MVVNPTLKHYCGSNIFRVLDPFYSTITRKLEIICYVRKYNHRFRREDFFYAIGQDESKIHF